MIIAITCVQFYGLACFCDIFFILRVTDIVPILIYFFKYSKALDQRAISHLGAFLLPDKIFVGSSYSKIPYNWVFIINGANNFPVCPQRTATCKNKTIVGIIF